MPRDRVGVSLLKLDDAQSELLGPLLATALSPEGLLEARGVSSTRTSCDASRPRRASMPRAAIPACTTPACSARRRPPRPGPGASKGTTSRSTSRSCRAQPPVVAPLFIGANPARVLSGPQTGFRLLAAEEDLGRELVTLLPDERRKVALIRDTAFAEIVTGNDPKVRPLELEGLAAADMSAAEQQQLRRLIELYVGRLTPLSAKDALLRLDRAGFGKVRFAWAGGLESGDSNTTTACTARRCSSNTTTRRTTPTTSTPCIATSTTTSVATRCAQHLSKE